MMNQRDFIKQIDDTGTPDLSMQHSADRAAAAPGVKYAEI